MRFEFDKKNWTCITGKFAERKAPMQKIVHSRLICILMMISVLVLGIYTIVEGEKDCYLLANGLGGYSSLSVIGAAARGDQALLMSAQKAPNVRMHLGSIKVLFFRSKPQQWCQL